MLQVPVCCTCHFAVFFRSLFAVGVTWLSSSGPCLLYVSRGCLFQVPVCCRCCQAVCKQNKKQHKEHHTDVRTKRNQGQGRLERHMNISNLLLLRLSKLLLLCKFLLPPKNGLSCLSLVCQLPITLKKAGQRRGGSETEMWRN